MRALPAALLAFVLLPAGTASAHPVPFSYIDVNVHAGAADVVVVAHMIDIAHDLNVDPPETLLQPEVLRQHSADVAGLLSGRFHLRADGRELSPGPWSAAEALVERQSIRITGRYPLDRIPGSVTLDALMFPYDPQHQTFVNFYESDTLALQAILDGSKTRVEYFSASRQGVFAVVRRFVVAGIQHIVMGPDHLLFLIGLMLLGGSLRQLAVLATAFTVAQAVTLSLATLNLVNPPSRIIEPAIALSIVYLGADNLMVRDGRDMRLWIAFGFGFIHGFGYANVLRETDLPRAALGWSLFSFNLGVEIGQLLVVGAVATALSALRSRSEVAGRRLAFGGSIAVMAAGAFWFIQRVFFPGGIA
jgi:hydrogenase/urease accessory protein HupE